MVYSKILITEEPIFPFLKEDIKSIGRYKKTESGITYICDVIFGELISESWSIKEKEEYLSSNNGFYRNWTYDLSCSSMKEIVMQWIDEIPFEERNHRNVIRHIMSRMSSDNSGDNGLIVGKWGGLYSDGRPPSHWTNSSSIFDERKKTGKSVKYGQCWCFAECMTSICRFLGIACRTICGKNTLIDENLDNGVDFKEDLTKGSEDTTKFILLDKSSLLTSLTNLSKNIVDKGHPWEELMIYDSGDSYWNIHYWNEIWIPNFYNELGEWEIIDSTPISNSISNDLYNGMKLSGPSKISDFNSKSINVSHENFDFYKLFSMINSPYRLWTTETITENEELISIPFVYSIVYPWNERISVYIKIPQVQKLFLFLPTISTRICGTPSTISEDITNNYKSPSSKLKNIYFKDAYLDGQFYTQRVYLDNLGNVISVNRKICTVFEMREDELKNSINGCYLISYLIIEIVNSGKPRWISFCEYNK